jgi:hypothetical protein
MSDIEFSFSERLVMNLYLFLVRHSQSDVKALGFDASTAVIEQMSLGFEGGQNFKLVERV